MTIPLRINGEIIYAEHLNTLREEILALASSPVTTQEDYVLENTYRLIVADPTNQAINITLPDPALNSGRSYIIKALEPLATYDLSNAVTLVGSVDGDTNYTFLENKQSIKITSTGATWAVV